MQFHAGYISDGIKNYLYKRNGPLDWKDILYFLSVFDIETNENLITLNSESLFAVADNIISRGMPTKPSMYVEKALADTLNWSKRDINPIGEINYKLVQGDVNKLQFLKRAFINIDPRIRNIQFDNICDNDSVLEDQFFNTRLGQTFGQHCLQILESQRSLPDIIKFCGNTISKTINDLANNFIQDNSVDFSFQFPKNNGNMKNGIVIEIDDATHEDTAQQGFDILRDNAVSDNKVNWDRTLRLRQYGNFDEINVIPTRKIDYINAFLQHPFNLQLENNFNNPLYQIEDGLDALQIALTPIAVARIQKTMIQLLRSNILRINQVKWKIAILERDVPCGVLAIEDLKQLLINLFKLRNENYNLPEIDLRIYNTEEFTNAKLNQLNKTEIYDESGLKNNEYDADILIDISTLQRPKFTKPSTEFINKIGNPTVFIVRSSYAPKSERKVSIAPVITYSAIFENNFLKQSNLKSLKYFIRNIFRKVGFRAGQLEIINKAIQRQNVIGLLPTGSGKSLCYQICGLLQPGITIIVDPLISLMKDQVQNLDNMDIKYIDKINSEITNPEERSFRVKRMAEGFNQFIFISPERFQIQEFRDALEEVRNESKFLQVVIDEAHCVSEWGHDFRPAYLHLGKNARNLISEDVILFGLTGTASFDVLSDVAREVNINQQGLVEANSFDRKELRFSIQEKRYKPEQALSGQKMDILKNVLRQIPRYFGYSNITEFYNERDENGLVNCGIIFVPYKSINYKKYSPFCVGTVSYHLHNYFNTELGFGINIGKYSSMLANYDRERIQNDFKNNETQILISTNAFGMGIDKPNIRFIIHYSCPQSIEAYYQEAGRAGRDRNKALCVSIFSDDKVFFQKLNNEFTNPFYFNISGKEYLDEETKGAEAIEKINNIFTNFNYDHRVNNVNGNIYFNYTNYFLSNNNSNEEISKIPETNFKDNDATRRGYFQGLNFPGKNVEKKIFGGILSKIDLNTNRSVIPFRIEYRDLVLNDVNEGNGYVERGIYRLAIIGVINDYIKDYNANHYKVEINNIDDEQIIDNMKIYVSRYKSQAAVNNVRNEILNQKIPGNDQRVLYKAIYYLIDFIYENIEKKRRNALREFIRVLRIGSSNITKFREELDNYFNSKYLPILRTYITNYDICVLWDLIRDVDNNYDLIRHLHGAAVRMLIAYDDNLLFQLIRSYTSFFHPEFDKREAMDYFNAFEKTYLLEDLNKPNREKIGNWIDKFYFELTSRQPNEINNISSSILNYELNILKNFNNKFLTKT